MEFTLRAWQLTDAADIAAAIGNPKVLQNLRDGIPYPYTEQDGLDFLGGVLSAPAESQYCWAIDVGGRAVGSIGFFRQQNIHSRTAELGYFLAEPYWGKGIMSRAVRQACDWLFEHTDLLRLFAEPFAPNAASCKVLEKAGFTREGTLRKNAVKNGVVLDMQLYALIKED